MASNTILSGMISALLPPDHFSVEAVLPPGQCPGHYDIKLSDIEKMKKAALIISFLGMPFADKTVVDDLRNVRIDASGRNWMTPDSYIHGLDLISDELAKRFPAHRLNIMERKDKETLKINAAATRLFSDIKHTAIFGKPVIVSSMQKEMVQWMGFRVVAEYGRPEALSAKDIVRLTKKGKEQGIIAVIDNLQSGPDTGKRIAEALGASHVVLTNFPADKGYLTSLEDNVKAVMAATRQKQSN